LLALDFSPLKVTAGPLVSVQSVLFVEAVARALPAVQQAEWAVHSLVTVAVTVGLAQKHNVLMALAAVLVGTQVLGVLAHLTALLMALAAYLAWRVLAAAEAAVLQAPSAILMVAAAAVLVFLA
jgi:hypothetical protein